MRNKVSIKSSFHVLCPEPADIHLFFPAVCEIVTPDTFLLLGKFSIRLRDEGRSVSCVDPYERRRLEVSHLSHGRGRFRREESCVLRCRDLLRLGGSASRTNCLQVSKPQRQTCPCVAESRLHSLSNSSSLSVSHRDLKPENILLDDHGQ